MTLTDYLLIAVVLLAAGYIWGNIEVAEPTQSNSRKRYDIADQITDQMESDAIAAEMNIADRFRIHEETETVIF